MARRVSEFIQAMTVILVVYYREVLKTGTLHVLRAVSKECQILVPLWRMITVVVAMAVVTMLLYK